MWNNFTVDDDYSWRNYNGFYKGGVEMPLHVYM